jgi:predicted XRE-type DNA-binding protein
MFSQKQLNNFWRKVDRKCDNECWEWTASLSRLGYGMVRYNDKTKYTHRLSFIIHHNREIEDGKHILHSCDNRKCVNPNHLREGTHQENMGDKMERGRHNNGPPRLGEKHPNHKLTWEIVETIKRRFNEETITHKQLAEEYGVGRATVSDILKGRTWRRG